MKKILVSILFLLPLFTVAQNTWVRKLSYMEGYQGYPFTCTGVDQIKSGIDGSLFVLAHINARSSQELFKFIPNSNQLAWTVTGGHHGTGVVFWIQNFCPTSDSGVVCCHNVDDQFGIHSTV